MTSPLALLLEAISSNLEQPFSSGEAKLRVKSEDIPRKVLGSQAERHPDLGLRLYHFGSKVSAERGKRMKGAGQWRGEPRKL